MLQKILIGFLVVGVTTSSMALAEEPVTFGDLVKDGFTIVQYGSPVQPSIAILQKEGDAFVCLVKTATRDDLSDVAKKLREATCEVINN